MQYAQWQELCLFLTSLSQSQEKNDKHIRTIKAVPLYTNEIYRVIIITEIAMSHMPPIEIIIKQFKID